MLGMHRSLKRPRQSSNNSSPIVPTGQSSEAETLPLQDPVSELLTPANSSIKRSLFMRPPGRLFEDRDNLIGTLHFGSTSLESLLLGITDSIPNLIDSDAQEVNDATVIQNRINSFVGSRCPKHLSGAALPTEPPLVLLECMLEPYFSVINPHFPIWSRDRFQKMVTSLQQEPKCLEDEWASIVCCNNLILIKLTADSMHFAQRRAAQSGSKESNSVSTMTFDLIAGFLANSKRAIENLGLLSPRLVNLQALLSLVCNRSALPVAHTFHWTNETSNNSVL